MNYIKIYNEPALKKIVWTATTFCNYSCSYCPEDLHDNKHRWPSDYTSIINFINKWRDGQPVMLDILGGEPTLWPKFANFCEDLIASSDQPTKIIFSSNGARSLRYWEEFTAPISSLGLSFHPEEADVEHFLNVVNILHEKYPLTIWLMLSYPHLETIKSIFERLKSFKVKVRVMSVVGKINNSHTSVVSDIAEYNEFATTHAIDQALPPRGPSYRTYASDGINNIHIQPQDLINNKQDAFKGWNCFVGKDSLYIDPEGNVSGSSCSAGPRYGNVYNDYNISTPTAPIVCPHSFCGCGSDVEIEKYK